MSVYEVKTHKRGLVLSFVISVMKPDDVYHDTVTKHINVNDLAEVFAKLRKTSYDHYLELAVVSKKCEAAKNLTVSCNISSEGTERQIVCQDEWVEVRLKNICRSCPKNTSEEIRPLLFIVKVDITVQVTMPVGLPISTHLYEDTECTDVKLKGADGVVAFHRNVLFVQSETFRTLLQNASGIIKMNGESTQTLQHLKDFMYLGTVPNDGLEPLLLLAKRFFMNNLVAACVDKLISTVTPEAFDELAEFASREGIVELVKAFVRIPDDVVNGIRWYHNSISFED